MAPSNLCLHRGARFVERPELESVPAPPPTDTWFPLSHATVLNRVLATLTEAGFTTRSVQMALSRGNARFFGTIDLESPLVEGVSLAVGVRNSIDKSLPIGFCAGHRTFVCDNLSFRSEVVIARKHTRFGETRFAEAMGKAVKALPQFAEAEAARIRRFQETTLSGDQADSILLHAFEEGFVSHQQLRRVVREWRSPSYAAFDNLSLWSLFSAFTLVLGDVQKSNPQRFASLTMRLQHFIDARMGFSPVPGPAPQSSAEGTRPADGDMDVPAALSPECTHAA
jgi:hypothetical protein